MQGRAIGWVLAGVVCLLTLGTFGKARAVDFTLPGERRIEVHGFFETRLSFVGDDFNGQIDLARLWNLLNVEADVEIFPDGIGPFQSISGFARFLASYECVYSHGCGAFRSADSFGDRVNVMPAQLRPGQFINRSATIPVGVDPGNNGSSRALSSYLGGTAFPNSFNDMENFLPYIDVFGLASTPQYVAGYTNGTNISFYPAFDLNVVGGNPQSNVADLTGILQSADNLDPYRSRPPMPCPVGAENSLIPKDSEGVNVKATDPSNVDITEPVTADMIRGCLGYAHPSERRYFANTHSALGNLPINFRQREIAWDRGYSADEHELRELYLDMELADGDLFLRLGKQIVVWGKTLLFRNQDRWNPQDLSQGTLPSLEEVRVPQWMARGVYSLYDVGPLSNVRLEAVLNVDDFEPIDLGFCGESTAIEQVACAIKFGVASHGIFGLGVAGMEMPEPIWRDWSEWRGLEIGGRMEFLYKRASFALTAFYGWDDTPITEVVASYDRHVDVYSGRLVSRFAGVCRNGTEADCLIPTDLDDENPEFNPVLQGEVTELDAHVLLNDPTNQRLFHAINSATGRQLELIEQVALPFVFGAFLNGVPIRQAFNFVEPELDEALRERFPDDDDFRAAVSAIRSGRKALFGCGPLLDPTGSALTQCEAFDFTRAEGSVLYQEWNTVVDGELSGPVGSRALQDLGGVLCPPGQQSVIDGLCTVIGVVPGIDDLIDPKPDGGCQFETAFVGTRFRIVDITEGCTVLEAMSEQLQLGTFLIGSTLEDFTEEEIAACRAQDAEECPLIRALLGFSGLRLPVKRAGGNGAIGRRDLTWHGADSIGLTFQKVPVFGFAMDFPEDLTRTNWSIEGSYVPDKLFSNTREEDGLSEGDEWVLSVSVTRSNFIRFVNPTSPFLFNLQTFFRWLPDHEGNGREGTVTQSRSVAALSTFFIATGYFQNRLTPSLSFVHDWESASGAIFASMGYRFTNNLVGSVSLRTFYARPTHVDQGLTQALLGNNPTYTGDGFKGLSSFRQRDEIAIRVRYSF